MGHPTIETPNLDQLAKQSVVFRHCCATALCRPALMTLTTGLYSPEQDHGKRSCKNSSQCETCSGKGPAYQRTADLHIDETGALPKWLSKRGYVSHQSGKWWEGSINGGFTHGVTMGSQIPVDAMVTRVQNRANRDATRPRLH